MSTIEVIKQKIIEKIIDSIWGDIILMISFPIIATYAAYLTDTINVYAPFSYFIAFCIGLLITFKIIDFKRYNKYKTSAEIKFHLYGDARTPEMLFNQNIWRWYNLNVLNLESKEVLFNSLFISFDKPILTGTLKITSPDMKLPIYEVKEYNNRFAIIVFNGQLPSGTLVVSSSV